MLFLLHRSYTFFSFKINVNFVNGVSSINLEKFNFKISFLNEKFTFKNKHFSFILLISKVPQHDWMTGTNLESAKGTRFEVCLQKGGDGLQELFRLVQMNAFTGSSNLIKKINQSVFKGLLKRQGIEIFYIPTYLHFQPRRKTFQFSHFF